MITPLTLTKKNNMLNSSTIAAISTPPGKGGVAVIRISGTDALSVGEKIFRPKGKPIRDRAPRTQIFGYILSGGEEIDDGLLTYFPENSSYTGEETVEISCHGGILISKAVLEAALSSGARPAEPGEFTKRAFMNGRLSLTDTEAIGLLLEAESEAQIKLTRKASRSALDNAIEGIRGSLTSLLSSVYARIDYPDEDLGDYTDSELCCGLDSVIANMDLLLKTYRTGKAVTEGVKTVIAGKPNVGTSSLYNLLAGYDAAIVTDIPGTTRDVLERSVSLGSVMLRLYDTAGIRKETSDRVEAIGIERSIEALESAELILALFSLEDSLSGEDAEIIGAIEEKRAAKIAVLTKGDLKNGEKSCNGALVIDGEDYSDRFDAIIEISAKNSPTESLKALSEVTERLFTDEKIRIGDDAIISSARQKASLTRAKELAESALLAIRSGLPQDAASSDIELSLGAIAELDGRAVSEEVTADIFSKFCVGK